MGFGFGVLGLRRLCEPAATCSNQGLDWASYGFQYGFMSLFVSESSIQAHMEEGSEEASVTVLNQHV